MENKKALEVVERYQVFFQKGRTLNVKYPHDKRFRKSGDVMAHCNSMLKGIKDFLSGDGEKRDRALIRLGFVQGCMAALGIFTIKDLKEHNRPDDGTISGQTHEPLTREDLQDWEY